MKKYTYFTVSFLSFGMPFSAFSTEDELALLKPHERYLRLMEQADLFAEAGNQALADQLLQKAHTEWETTEGQIAWRQLKPNERYLCLMERANLFAEAGNQALADQLRQEAEAIWAAYSLVDVAKYRTANPDPLDAIPENAVLQIGNKIGEGVCGQVYDVWDSNGQRLVLKAGDINDDAEIGQFIRDICHNIMPQTQLADIQGLELAVPGKKLNGESLVQKKVQGWTIDTFWNFFRNHWIDSPQKALERLCSMMSSLYALEKAGIIHYDLLPRNIMIEAKKLPDALIAAKVEAKARQITGITEEEKDLTEENKQALNEARATARADLLPEDQYEYIPRIIDFGRSQKINGNETDVNLSKDIHDIGILIPFFLFGNMGTRVWEICFNSSKWNAEFACVARTKLIQDKKNSGNAQDQLALEVMFLEDTVKSLEKKLFDLCRPTPPKDIAETEAQAKAEISSRQMALAKIQAKSAKIQAQIEDKNRTYEITYGETIQEYKARFEVELKARTDAVRNQYVMEKFYEANAAMQAAIGKSYPEPVLKELVQFTADCLSTDPTRIPTAEEGCKKITNLLLFSNWSSGQ
ncbi:MAG: hypothetical protein LBF25_00120 [Puniceicoccales bacterium]|nr:hypothetical protein [Puniceicoccales bacterium]